jgi:hypothetical protein
MYEELNESHSGAGAFPNDQYELPSKLAACLRMVDHDRDL